jgi:hypothetical protein
MKLGKQSWNIKTGFAHLRMTNKTDSALKVFSSDDLRLASVDHPSIAHLPRSVRGFFALRHFGVQAVFASTRRSFP